MSRQMILWRRLDMPGHDACALHLDAGQWHLQGAAVWGDRRGPARIGYDIICDQDWVARSARLQGNVGGRAISLSIRRGSGGEWRANGDEVPDSHRLAGLDLGFTPATNTIPLNRLRPEGGGDSAALWLDDGDWTLKPLHQGYRLAPDGTWCYRSAETDFQTTLTVNRHGFVTDYPGLWTQED